MLALESRILQRSSAPRPRHTQILFACGLLLYWGLMMVAFHIPLQREEQLTRLPIDKVVHFSAYGMLALLLLMASDGFVSLPGFVNRLGLVPKAMIILACVSLHGLADEFTQPLTGRDFDWWDWAADISGSASALVLYGRMLRRRLERT
jgi:VanZ family protein